MLSSPSSFTIQIPIRVVETSVTMHSICLFSLFSPVRRSIYFILIRMLIQTVQTKNFVSKDVVWMLLLAFVEHVFDEFNDCDQWSREAFKHSIRRWPTICGDNNRAMTITAAPRLSIFSTLLRRWVIDCTVTWERWWSLSTTNWIMLFFPTQFAHPCRPLWPLFTFGFIYQNWNNFLMNFGSGNFLNFLTFSHVYGLSFCCRFSPFLISAFERRCAVCSTYCLRQFQSWFSLNDCIVFSTFASQQYIIF